MGHAVILNLIDILFQNIFLALFGKDLFTILMLLVVVS